MKNNQKGFTLIELIVVVAIIAIFALTIGAFVTSGSSSFRSLSNNARAQIELQETEDQVKNFMIDANSCVNINGGVGDESIDQTKVPQKTVVELFQFKTNTDGSSKKTIDTITWEKSSQELRYKRVSKTMDALGNEGTYGEEAEELLAENVSNFQASVTKSGDDRVMVYYLKLDKQGLTIDGEHSVKLRNKIQVNVAGYDFQDLPDKEPVKIEILCPEEIPSGTATRFTCSIKGFVQNTQVKWEVLAEGTAAEASASKFENGLFYAKGKGVVSVQVTALGDPNLPQATAKVTLLVK